jgi:hypothetical protein
MVRGSGTPGGTSRGVLAISPVRIHIGAMYENREGEFAYTIRRRTFRGGKTVWRWEVRHGTESEFVDCGISLRSHDAAETSALDAIFSWNSGQALATR